MTPCQEDKPTCTLKGKEYGHRSDLCHLRPVLGKAGVSRPVPLRPLSQAFLTMVDCQATSQTQGEEGMTIKWRGLPFIHRCGLKGTILEVCLSSDGSVAISGLCVVCGEEFTIEEDLFHIIGRMAVCDYIDNCKDPTTDLLENFSPQGKPS